MKVLIRKKNVTVTLTKVQLSTIFAALDSCAESDAHSPNGEGSFDDVRGVYIKLSWALHKAVTGGEL